MEHEIEKLRTKSGGYTKADLARYGVPWPPPKGWLKELKRREREASAPRPSDPPASPGTLYTHNSTKPFSAYHIATARGTACKLERSKFMKYQDTVTETPPPGKRLCAMCRDVTERRELDAQAWERLAAF